MLKERHVGKDKCVVYSSELFTSVYKTDYKLYIKLVKLTREYKNYAKV